MQNRSNDAAVLVVTRDLFFRAKLEGLIKSAGARVASREPAALAVVELGTPAALERVRELAASGIRVVAFGSHVDADTLRAAREAGAEAVPNSRIEAVLLAALAQS